ncbi:MAG: hypothetical protein WCJ26_00710 [bacterium]
MKTKKYFFTALVFLTGMVSGISIIGFMSFTSAPAMPSPGITPLTSAVAHSYFNNYLSGATAYNQVIKGFTIDKAQLSAMNSIAAENASLTGFRIYMGKDNNSNRIGIVVGIDNAGNDAVGNTIYSTDTQSLSPCPPVCDVNSPIILNR